MHKSGSLELLRGTWPIAVFGVMKAHIAYEGGGRSFRVYGHHIRRAGETKSNSLVFAAVGIVTFGKPSACLLSSRSGINKAIMDTLR